MKIRTILCPIDFSNLSAREIESAAEVARAFGGRLILHHNRIAIAPGLARAWDWEATHCAERVGDAERRMTAALAAVPANIPAEGVISVGPVGQVILLLAEQLPADLIVIGSHGWSTEEHASVSERVIAQAPCPVLILHEGGEPLLLGTTPGGPPSLHAVVPTDLSSTACRALEYAYALARALPLDLEVLHVLPGGPHRSAAAENTARERLEAAVPDDLTTRVVTCIRYGDPSSEILACLAEVRPQFTVLGEHARGIVRRLFTRDTTRAVLHDAPCPVWIVPARATGIPNPGKEGRSCS
jgi:universal stress protein A